MYAFGDQALICACKVDRAMRHNALRNCTYSEAVRAGLRPEAEREGLLPPEADGIRATVDSLRRPTDVWLLRARRVGAKLWTSRASPGCAPT